jgi:hypothetical protein
MILSVKGIVKAIRIKKMYDVPYSVHIFIFKSIY